MPLPLRSVSTLPEPEHGSTSLALLRSLVFLPCGLVTTPDPFLVNEGKTPSNLYDKPPSLLPLARCASRGSSVTMSAVANEGMNVSVGNPEVQTLLIGTGEAFSVYAFGSASPAFDLAPGPPREWQWTRTS
jgi:hypothetical protein